MHRDPTSAIYSRGIPGPSEPPPAPHHFFVNFMAADLARGNVSGRDGPKSFLPYIIPQQPQASPILLRDRSNPWSLSYIIRQPPHLVPHQLVQPHPAAVEASTPHFSERFELQQPLNFSTRARDDNDDNPKRARSCPLQQVGQHRDAVPAIPFCGSEPETRSQTPNVEVCQVSTRTVFSMSAEALIEGP